MPSTDPSSEELADQVVDNLAQPTPQDTDANLADSSPADSPDAKPADSSPADDTDAKPKTSLDAVTAVLKEQAEASSSPESGQEGPEGKLKAEGEKPEGDEDPDEKPPFHEHPVWQKKLAQIKELKGQVETYEDKAGRLDKLANFCRESNLDNTEVAAGFEVMSLIKNKPEDAIPVLEGYLTKLKQAAGYELPVDLRQRVESGYISEEDAQQLSVSNSRAARAHAEAEAARQRADELDQQTDAAKRQQANVDAVEAWNKQWQDSDPDYPKKVSFVVDEIERQQAKFWQEHQRIPTPSEAVQIAESSKRAAFEKLKPFTMQRPSIDPPPSGDTSVRSTRVPKTSMEAVDMALQSM